MSIKSKEKHEKTTLHDKKKEKDCINTNIDKEVRTLRSNLEIPVSDDSLDFLETQIDTLNDTKNLGTKVTLHAKIMDYTKRLESEVDNMIELMDKIDYNVVSEAIKKNKNNADTSDVSDDIINLDKLLSDLQEEDVMQIKLLYMRKIIDQIERCRSKCEKSKMTVNKCN